MADPLSDHYQELLEGSYDCVDRIVLNAYFGMAHSPGGFRVWWRRLYGSDDQLDNAHLMRLAGRFSRRLYAWAKAARVPVVHCSVGERKHERAEEYLATHPGTTAGIFLIAVSRAPAPVWEIHPNRQGGVKHIARKKSMPYVNHYSFHILDPEWGHVTMKICGHPPFPAQVILNGHEFVACQAEKVGIDFTKEGNCFTQIGDAAGLGRVADTLSAKPAIGRLNQVCERWIYTCLSFALDSEEQAQSGFRYRYSTYQVEYSRNLLFEVGGKMEQVFQALVERTRAPLDVRKIKTILGRRRRPKTRPHRKRAREWGIVVETPVYGLTVFKIHCGHLTLKIYTKGERVLRIEALVHNAGELGCRRSLDYFPEIVTRLRQILERFVQTLAYLDRCFIADDLLERLPTCGQVGATRVGGIDFNQPRMRRVTQALLALSASPAGFTASALAERVRSLGLVEYGARRATYDLKKFRAKELVRKIERTHRYEVLPQGLRSLAALLILRDKVIKPLLAAAGQFPTGRKPNAWTPVDEHYETLRQGMHNLFTQLGIAA